MNRRAFLRTILGAGSLPLVAGVSRGSTVGESAADGSMVRIRRGHRVVDQARYDDGSRPEESPDYEIETTAINAATAAAVDAGRGLVDELRAHVADLDTELSVDADSAASTAADVGAVGISIQYADDGLRLFVDCPEGVDTDRVAAGVDSVASAVRSAAADRLPEGLSGVEIRVRDRPTISPERACVDSIGRFADAQYRSQGIAMGAAVRSEALGEIASTGFRGLRAGRAVVVTTAHTFRSRTVADAADIRGDRLYQSRRPHAIGRCHAVGWRDDPEVDAAAAAVDTDTYPSRYLAEPGGDSYTERPIVGTASWELLETALAEERPIYRQGAVTGRCEGTLTELRTFDNGYRELDVDIHSGGGDSGGPYLLPTDGGYLVAGVHLGTREDGPLRRAVFVGSVLDSLGVDIY
ncbi:hypothetical protein [Halohasta salina]|uniref:hypothetical protein n=1 Tax=Halohasta salina TaxID=2961621 RepID=UPI0020A540B2|nr:hypothetical protein [Halohasta salina]